MRSKLYRHHQVSRSRFSSHLPQSCPLSGTQRTDLQESLTLEAFARQVARVLDSLPVEIADKLANVAITVEDTPSDEVLAEKGIANPDELFGSYLGVPRPWRSAFAPLAEFPDKIELYYQPIRHAGLRPREIRELVRRIIVHEVGSHFGMSNH
ncbi:MAG: metallopeptidase family protein [Candidatus Binatia bacterium]